MARFVLTKVATSLLTLVLALVVIFLGVRALPGDAAVVIANADTSGLADEDAIREQLGLDRPLPVQFVDYVGQILSGQLGRSTSTGLPAGEVIAGALPVTLELAFLALLLATAFGVFGGIVAAVRRGRAAEWGMNGIALFGLSVPPFWFGIMLILFFSVHLRWLPASGFVPFFEDPLENLRRMILPAIVLSSGFAAVTMRQMRAAMLETLNADFIRTAEARGLSRNLAVWTHAVRNSLISVVTVVSVQLGILIGGAVVTEQVFVIPGFGKLMVDAITGRDYAIIQGVVLVTAVIYVVANLLTDIAYGLIDPRVRVQGRRR